VGGADSYGTTHNGRGAMGVAGGCDSSPLAISTATYFRYLGARMHRSTYWFSAKQGGRPNDNWLIARSWKHPGVLCPPRATHPLLGKCFGKYNEEGGSAATHIWHMRLMHQNS